MKLKVTFDKEEGNADIFTDVLHLETHTDHIVLFFKNKRREIVRYSEFDSIVIEKEED